MMKNQKIMNMRKDIPSITNQITDSYSQRYSHAMMLINSKSTSLKTDDQKDSKILNEPSFLQKAKEKNQMTLEIDTSNAELNNSITMEVELSKLNLEMQIEYLKQVVRNSQKDIKRIEAHNRVLNKENFKLKEIIKDKEQTIKNLTQKSKINITPKVTKTIKKDDSKQDISTSNDEFLYYVYDIFSKIPESKSYDVMYKYLTDAMKYLLKVETWIILK